MGFEGGGAAAGGGAATVCCDRVLCPCAVTVGAVPMCCDRTMDPQAARRLEAAARGEGLTQHCPVGGGGSTTQSKESLWPFNSPPYISWCR